MTDGVNRISPPPVSLDRPLPAGKERNKRRDGRYPQTDKDPTREDSTSDRHAQEGDHRVEKSKGKNLDINA
jgi:hypothetical protein